MILFFLIGALALYDALVALRHIDRYEWVGIAGGVIILAALTGVLGPTLDADDAEHLAQAEREQTHYASR